MPGSDDIRWFKSQFDVSIAAAVAGTPLTSDFMAALACQETGEVWPLLRKAGMPLKRLLELCVGDTLDADRGRSAFPRGKSELLAAPRGAEMFDLARKALVDMAAHVGAYAGAARNPNKFCHGFGIFQLDLQYFKTEPDFFLDRDYAVFEKALGRCLLELNHVTRQLGFEGRDRLSDLELASIAIAYNTGGYKPAKGLQQGYFDGRKYYGETFFDYLRLAHTVESPAGAALLPAPAAGEAVLAAPAVALGKGAGFKVHTSEGMLRLRSEPQISDPPQANVLANLPEGQPVRALANAAKGGFLEVETSLGGAYLRGFCSRKFLVPDAAPEPAPTEPGPAERAPAAAPSGIVAVYMPRKPGTVTRRTAPANAHSLNEARQPGRAGTGPEELRQSIAAIIDWLAVDNPAYLRYQPHDGLTFCNIYAHDFCHLAGAYLPRVWWTSPALLKLAAGQTVEPLYGSTIEEKRANDLFRWLADFGPDFGWSRAGNLTDLQTEVNQGALGIIVARRKEDGRSGHIVMVVPEDGDNAARRDAQGKVTAPLQSQAGATNFRRGRGRANWWNGEEFADNAFWLHA